MEALLGEGGRPRGEGEEGGEELVKPESLGARGEKLPVEGHHALKGETLEEGGAEQVVAPGQQGVLDQAGRGVVD